MDEYRSILEKHVYESAIFPKRNEFTLGQTVYIDRPRGVKGIIHSFVSNGTLFIKKKDDKMDMGRNYAPSSVFSLNCELDTNHSKTSVGKLLKEHTLEIESYYQSYSLMSIGIKDPYI